MPLISKMGLVRLIHLLNRFVPVVSRGLALGFAILAVATAFFGMGDYPGASERYLVGALFAVFAIVSFGIGLATKPILKWVLRQF